MQYIFTAVFKKDAKGSINIKFPDLPDCRAKGMNMLDAVKKSQSVLSLCLFDMEQQGLAIPEPRFPDELTIEEGEIASIILVDTSPYHTRFGEDTADYTLSIPAWLAEVVNTSKLDLSQLLQGAVRQRIGMPAAKVMPKPKPKDIDASSIKEALDVAPPPVPIENFAVNHALQGGGRVVLKTFDPPKPPEAFESESSKASEPEQSQTLEPEPESEPSEAAAFEPQEVVEPESLKASNPDLPKFEPEAFEWEERAAAKSRSKRKPKTRFGRFARFANALMLVLTVLALIIVVVAVLLIFTNLLDDVPFINSLSFIEFLSTASSCASQLL